MSSKEATYRAQLGEALVQILELQSELQALKEKGASNPNILLLQDSNRGLAKQALDHGAKIEDLQKENQELATIRIKQSDRIGELIEERVEAANQIKLLQTRLGSHRA